LFGDEGCVLVGIEDVVVVGVGGLEGVDALHSKVEAISVLGGFIVVVDWFFNLLWVV